MVSSIHVVKRALATLLNALAGMCGLLVDLARESADTEVRTACKTVVRKANPDKGGAPDHQKVVTVAKGRMRRCDAYWRESWRRPHAPRRKKLRFAVPIVHRISSMSQTLEFQQLLSYCYKGELQQLVSYWHASPSAGFQHERQYDF